MVRDHTHANVVVMTGAIAAACHLLHGLDDREDLVDLVHIGDALLEESDALKTETGINVLLRQLAKDRELVLTATRASFVLHEHEVPDLDVTVLVRNGAALFAKLGATINIDLRARPGGARLPG